MSSPEPEDAGQRTEFAQLFEALGDKSWHARKRAVDRLATEDSSELAQQLLEILRAEHRDLSRLNAAIQVLTATPVDVVPALQEVLHADEADIRGYAALALGLRGDPRPIPALIAALADVDTNVRVQAIEALGSLKSAAAVDELMRIVEGQEFSTAFPALDALGEIGDGRIAHRLLPLLADPFWQPAVIEALGKLGNEEAVPPLLELLANSAESAEAIALSICQIHDRSVNLFGSGKAVSDAVRNLGGRSVFAIIHDAIATAAPGEAIALTTLLTWSPGNEADALLAKRLELPTLDGSEIERIAQRGTALIPTLLNLLQNDDERICIAAVEVLSRMRDERSYTPSLALLRHPSAGVRQAAIALLNSLGNAALSVDLPLLLRDPGPHVRESAVRIAAYLGISSCLDLIFELARGGDEGVRRAALAHLPALDDVRTVPCIIEALDDNDPRIRAAAVNALAEVDDSQAVALLQQSLNDTDVWVRYHAARALWRADYHRRSVDNFVHCALHDPAMQVRIAATEALGDYGSGSIQTLTQLAEDTDGDLAQAAICSLGRTRNLAIIPLLLEKLKSNDRTTALAAAQALGESRQPNAVPPLELTARGRDREVAEAAIAALANSQLAESRDALLNLAEIPANRRSVANWLSSKYSGDVAGMASRLQTLPLDVRRLMIEVLSRIRSPAALELMEASLNDPEPVVRFAALAALSHLRNSPPLLRTATGKGQI